MIAGYHLIWTAYGWWLPNDPRGSTSHEIRVPALADLGELHYGRKAFQPAGRTIREFYEAARTRLKDALLTFSDAEILTVGKAFADVIRQRNYTCYGCAILPDHVHLLIRKHRDQAETMIAAMQDASRTAIQQLGTRAADHPVWGGPGWKVFLETREDLQRTVAYIHKNLVPAKRADQTWPFVQSYDGWLPGQVRIMRRLR
jgi:REP element-mobilizing transposase RayT